MLCSLFGSDSMQGRDSFYRLLRRHRLMLPPRKKRHTTDSNHRYHKWKNLISGQVPTAANQIWVADITYIDLADGQVCYLHLITDAYSRKIVGWMLADTLRATITLQALEQAIEQAYALKGGGSLEGLIHHSDRGVQYCCDDYVSMLQKHHIAISMTEDNFFVSTHKGTQNIPFPQLFMRVSYTELTLRKFGHNARRIATCWGVAPFGRDSGTTLHVSHYADKYLKSLLFEAALCAMRFCAPIRRYTNRLLARGKHQNIVRNNVKNKMLHILVAMVGDGECFSEVA